MDRPAKVPLDDVLIEVDAEQIAASQPILSAVVRGDETGLPGYAFWHAVDKYKLRREGETDEQVVSRLTEEAFAFFQPKQ